MIARLNISSTKAVHVSVKERESEKLAEDFAQNRYQVYRTSETIDSTDTTITMMLLYKYEKARMAYEGRRCAISVCLL